MPERPRTSDASPLTLVTGGAGFIGSHLVDELVARGERVRVLDDFSTGASENLEASRDSIELIDGDLRDADAVRRAVEGATFVLHIGALGSVPRSVNDPLTSNAVNVVGTLNVLEAARAVGVQRFVLASSSSVYGNVESLPQLESATPGPLSPYAVTKLTSEWYCRVYNSVYGLETVTLRYFNVFGPRQSPRSQYAAVVPRFIDAIVNDRLPVIYGDGRQSRDFTYVENVVHGTLLARTAAGTAGGVFNLACEEVHTLLELVDLINELLGKNLAPEHADPQPGDVRHTQAAIGAAKGWGYEVRVGFGDGLRRTIEAVTGQAPARP